MKKQFVPIILVFLVIIVSISIRMFNAQLKNEKEPIIFSSAKPTVPEIDCYDFVMSSMMRNGGIRTNALDIEFTMDHATGCEVLSESQGLIMRYAVATKNASLFTRAYDFTFTKMNQDVLAYRYHPENIHEFTINAAIDDLRIIRALLEASSQFSNNFYKQKALMLGDRLFDTNVSDSYLYDFYDSVYKVHNDTITLCYNDFYTLKQLSKYNLSWQSVYDNMLALTKKGYISDTLPFYEANYNYTLRQYTSKESINMIEALLTAYHLSEVDELPTISMDFIRNEISKGTLYAYYNKDGSPASEMESTAVYALAACLASRTHDMTLYKACIDNMNHLQVTDPENDIFGAFGDPYSGSAFSYDNLMALIAYRMGE